MAFDEELAARVRQALASRGDVTEKRMFGGLGFLVGGNMAVGSSHTGNLLVRMDADGADAVVGPGVEPMVMRGRTMRGWLYVKPEVIADDDALAEWVERGAAFAASLPPK